jgi:hypothetical protein
MVFDSDGGRHLVIASWRIVVGCDSQLEYPDLLCDASVALVHRLILIANNSTRCGVPDLVDQWGK